MLSLNNVLGASEQFVYGERLAGRRRIGEQEVIKVVDGFRASQLAEREVALHSRLSRLH